MSFWSAVVLIVLIGAITWLRSQKYRHGGSDQIASPQREAELEEKVETLRKRISVLERIAMDDRQGKDLAREIESLRD